MTKRDNNFFSMYLPYLGSFIIFLGMVRLIFYYSSFGVNIINFLDFSEIITSFLDIIVIVVILFTFSIIQRFLMTSKTENDKKKEAEQEIFNEPIFFKRLIKYLGLYENLLYSGFGILIVFFIMHYFNKSIDTTIYLISVIITITSFMILVINFEIAIKHKEFQSNENEKQFTSVLLNGIIFIGLVMMFSYNQIDTVKKHKSFYGVTILLDDNTELASDSCNYYIGKTNNYLFFYHEGKNITDVYPNSRIKQMTFIGKAK